MIRTAAIVQSRSSVVGGLRFLVYFRCVGDLRVECVDCRWYAAISFTVVRAVSCSARRSLPPGSCFDMLRSLGRMFRVPFVLALLGRKAALLKSARVRRSAEGRQTAPVSPCGRCYRRAKERDDAAIDASIEVDRVDPEWCR